VGIHAAWAERLGEAELARWKATGSRTHLHRGRGVEVTLPFALWSQCRAHAGVVLDHPAVIIHGLHDETIGIEHALALAKRSPGVRRLYGVADGHRLQASRHLMGEAIDLVFTP
jgi:pimeloyl-ACP methyl ester carboxylesterase